MSLNIEMLAFPSNGLISVTSVFGEVLEPTFVEIADYYDNRKAVVTVTGDDWGWYPEINPYFDDFFLFLKL